MFFSWIFNLSRDRSRLQLSVKSWMSQFLQASGLIKLMANFIHSRTEVLEKFERRDWQTNNFLSSLPNERTKLNTPREKWKRHRQKGRKLLFIEDETHFEYSHFTQINKRKKAKKNKTTAQKSPNQSNSSSAAGTYETQRPIVSSRNRWKFSCCVDFHRTLRQATSKLPLKFSTSFIFSENCKTSKTWPSVSKFWDSWSLNFLIL